MITPEELRMGNIVYRKYFNPHPITPKKAFQECEVYAIGIEKIIVNEKIGSNGLMKVDFDLIKSIPLTEEWLIKFGFHQNGKYFIYSFLDYNYCFQYANFRDNWGFYQEYTDSPFPEDLDKRYFISCGIKYLHQLQNLYFALTNEELVIK